MFIALFMPTFCGDALIVADAITLSSVPRVFVVNVLDCGGDALLIVVAAELYCTKALPSLLPVNVAGEEPFRFK